MAISTSEKTTAHPRRTTFLTGREVVQRSCTALAGARSALAAVPRSDTREQLLCDRLETLQADLAAALERFFEAVPEEALEEQSQYVVELPKQLEKGAPPRTPEEAVHWSRGLVRSLRSRFLELSGSAVAEDLREAYRSLYDLLAGYEERIVRLAEGERDL